MNSDIATLKESIESTTEITPVFIDSLNRLTLLQLGSQSAEAGDTAARTINEARSINYLKGEGQALLYAGIYASRQRDFEKAESLYRQALKIAEDVNFDEGLGEVHARIGNLKLADGKYNDALKHYGLAINIRQKLKDELGLADLYNNSGIIYGLQGNYPLALKSHFEALKTFESLGQDSRMASSYANLGLIFTEQQNYDEALRMYKRALEIREKADDTREVGNTLNNIGLVYYEQKNYAGALQIHEKALKIREGMGDKPNIAHSCSNLGNVYKELGQYEPALDFYNKALTYFKDVNDKRGLLQSYNNLGELYFALHKNDEANEYLTDAIKLAEQTGLKIQLRQALMYITEVFAREQKFEEAFNFHKRYTQADREISNTETSRQIAQMTYQHEIEQKERDAEAERVKNAELQKAYSFLEAEKQRSEELLNNILPEEVSLELKQFGKTKARSFDMVTVMFADIQGFTRISERLSAEDLVSGIDEYFEAFDKIVQKHGIEKIKTIGDAYLCACGVPVPVEVHAEKMIEAAQDFINAVIKLKHKRQSKGKHAFDFRIGVHSGPLVAGVVGIKKFAYDIWGDTVNTASRMQQHSMPNRINISETTYRLIQDKFACEFRGEIEAKNKGKLKMYFINDDNVG